MVDDARPVVHADLTDLLRQMMVRFGESDAATQRSFDRLNGQVQSAHVKLGGHETAIALVRDRADAAALRGHELTTLIVGYQRDVHGTLVLLERVQARLEAAESKAIQAEVKASAVEERVLERAAVLEQSTTTRASVLEDRVSDRADRLAEQLKERGAKMDLDIEAIKKGLQFDWRQMVAIVLTTLGLGWGVLKAFGVIS